jgi:GTP cyclohydrolase I
MKPEDHKLVHRAAKVLIGTTGEDLNREAFVDTPRRFADAWSEWTAGYSQTAADVLTTFEDGANGVDEMIFQGNITVWSLCQHHLAPFFGVAHIAYIPYGKIIGLSKFARLVDVFARRLQVQEQLTAQIADALVEYVQPIIGVGVVLQCRHACIESRGIRRAGSITQTAALRGAIKEEADARAEFYSLVAQASAKASF